MIDVVGIGARGWPDLPARLHDLIRRADVLLGSPRQLALMPPIPGQRRHPWPTPLRPGLGGFLARFDEDRVVALASGDPLLAGIGSTLIEVLGADRVTIHSALSSVALARARMGWPDDSVDVVRLRGDDVDQVRRFLYPGRRLVVLSRDADSPAEVAAVLTEAGFGDSPMTVFGDLDSDHETRIDSLARDRRAPGPPLNVVCVEAVGPPTGSLVPGLPDQAYAHDGQLSKRHVRASALAHLMPRPGELLWDVGAGAGSIGIEWMRAHPSCRAVAVERDPERAARLAGNARALGVPGLQVVVGEAPAALDGLPSPAAIFIGGGAGRTVIERCWGALPVGGRLVVHAVTHETEMVMALARSDHGGELTRIAIEHLESIGHFTGWKPARPVVQWSVVKEHS